MSLHREKESAPGVEVGRASVKRDEPMIPQTDWERGCRALALLVLLGWCAVWMMEVLG